MHDPLRNRAPEPVAHAARRPGRVSRICSSYPLTHRIISLDVHQGRRSTRSLPHRRKDWRGPESASAIGSSVKRASWRKARPFEGRCRSGRCRRRAYFPPVTSMKAPVVNDASPDSSHRMARATSSGSPPRFIGTCSFTRLTRSDSPPLACISVWMKPGRTAFTRMPSSATSRASPMVSVSMAPLMRRSRRTRPATRAVTRRRRR